MRQQLPLDIYVNKEGEIQSVSLTINGAKHWTADVRGINKPPLLYLDPLHFVISKSTIDSGKQRYGAHIEEALKFGILTKFSGLVNCVIHEDLLTVIYPSLNVIEKLITK